MADIADSSTVLSGETFAQYYGRNHEYWMNEAEQDLEERNIPLTGARLKTVAKTIAKKFFQDHQQ